MRDLLTLAPSLPAVPSAPFSPMPPCGKYPESLSYDTEWFILGRSAVLRDGWFYSAQQK